MRELSKLQELYDGQTRHGLDKIKQAEWEKELRRLWLATGRKLNSIYIHKSPPQFFNFKLNNGL
ncbi:hypothetical protein V8V91_02590 [Algoriphagus halophilus]|uniref:hypothetical protein n=1 Tax=Algoriphagus halophilus TaxID=226505 RepID=UPI00358F5C9B